MTSPPTHTPNEPGGSDGYDQAAGGRRQAAGGRRQAARWLALAGLAWLWAGGEATAQQGVNLLNGQMDGYSAYSGIVFAGNDFRTPADRDSSGADGFTRARTVEMPAAGGDSASFMPRADGNAFPGRANASAGLTAQVIGNGGPGAGVRWGEADAHQLLTVQVVDPGPNGAGPNAQLALRGTFSLLGTAWQHHEVAGDYSYIWIYRGLPDQDGEIVAYVEMSGDYVGGFYQTLRGRHDITSNEGGGGGLFPYHFARLRGPRERRRDRRPPRAPASGVRTIESYAFGFGDINTGGGPRTATASSFGGVGASAGYADFNPVPPGQNAPSTGVTIDFLPLPPFDAPPPPPGDPQPPTGPGTPDDPEAGDWDPPVSAYWPPVDPDGPDGPLPPSTAGVWYIPELIPD